MGVDLYLYTRLFRVTCYSSWTYRSFDICSNIDTVIFFLLLRISKKMGETLSKLYTTLDVLMRRDLCIDITNTLHTFEN